MPRTEDAEAESDCSNATLCGNCSKALQKPLVCKRVFITAGPITKLFAGGEEESGGHVL